MLHKIKVSNQDEIKEKVLEIIKVNEEPPEGADEENIDFEFSGLNGTLVVEPDYVQILLLNPLDDFPQKITFEKDYLGYDETPAIIKKLKGLRSHEPAIIDMVFTGVTLSEDKVWGIYALSAWFG
ncbi:MAG: hypothetical protein JXR91_08780 [Deltaproteobacteria bacterium]|nr:hypothetical protein [Deltaproteobacteria bacterium]